MNHLRQDFPLLARRLDDKPLVYLDSAATSLKPWRVLEAERAYATELGANVHRGRHALSEESSTAYEAARRRVARFLNADPGAVVFVRNTTEALNLVASGLSLARGASVLAPLAEHHSNLLPWMRRAHLHLFEHDVRLPLAPEQVDAELARLRPDVLTFSWASNVTGVVHPAAELCALARRHGVLTVVDAAQAAPHLPVDVTALDCDFLAFSGHKLLGPAGIGVLYGRPEALERLEPLLVGGGNVEHVTRTGFSLRQLPWRLEAGTPNIGGALGLAAALDYLGEIGFDALAEHERTLAGALEAELHNLPGVQVLMGPPSSRLALASIAPLAAQVSSDHLALALSDSFQIMVRSGFHCAHPLFDQLALPSGAVRASAYVYNTLDEIHRLGEALRVLLHRLLGNSGRAP